MNNPYALGTPSLEGDKKLTRWQDAIKDKEELRNQLRKAECEEANARNDMGKFFTPEDAKPGEVFNVWLGALLVQITLPINGGIDYKITLRKGGKVT